jgi:citrate lyase subunit beta / citryl-CoA lyase
MTTDRPRRSTLFAPGHRADLIAKLTRSSPDCVVLDLEDGTPPDAKADGRKVIEEALGEVDFGDAEVIVRVNSMDSPHAEDDLAWLRERRIRADAVMVPKVSGRQDLANVQQRLGSATYPLWILPTETAEGYASMAQSAPFPGVTAVIWAAEDFAADIGAAGSRQADGRLHEVFRVARAQTLLSAKAAGVSAIDTTYVDLGDLDGLRREAIECAGMGFDGKAAIHPSHVTVINEVFTPSRDAVDRAARLVRAFEAAGGGAIRFEDRMVDAPHYKQALGVLVRAGIAHASMEARL